MKTRHYNSLKVVKNKVHKTSSKDRITTEYLWYKKVKEMDAANIPQFSAPSFYNGTGTLTMEMLRGENAYEHLMQSSNQSSELQKLIKLLKSVTNKMHSNTASVSNLKYDIEHMYLTKALKALRYFYEQEGFRAIKNMTHLQLNGKKVIRPELIIHEVYKNIFEGYKPTTSLIHGDLTLSNSLMQNNKIYLIDPRGKFGETRYYGDSMYDIAKIYFSLITNFDNLNHHRFKLTHEETGVYTYEINEVVESCLAKEMFNEYFKYDGDRIKYIVSTIWLSLAPHLEESDEQTLVSFLVGAEMLDELHSKV